MIKGLTVAVALTMAFPGAAVAREAAHRHHPHHRPAVQAEPYPGVEPGPPADPRSTSYGAPDIYWSPAGGNPVHYAQTTGFYAGR